MSVVTSSPASFREYEPTKEDLLILREWIAKAPHILQDYDDNFLSAFIKARKGSLQNTKILLENFNALGYRFPKSFGHLDPLNNVTQDFFEANYLFPLPKRTEDGTIICMLAAKSDPDGKFNHSWYEFHRIWLMSIFVHVWEGITDTTRIILVYDCTYESLSRCKDVNPTFLRDVFTMLETSPTRVRGIHVVNMPSVCEPIFDIAKMLMKNKIIQRLHVHRNMNSLCEYIPRKYLPEEYGGCEASMRALHDLWKKKIESYRDKLIIENDKMRKRDPLRPRSKEHDEELEGTFRQLRID